MHSPKFNHQVIKVYIINLSYELLHFTHVVYLVKRKLMNMQKTCNEMNHMVLKHCLRMMSPVIHLLYYQFDSFYTKRFN